MLIIDKSILFSSAIQKKISSLLHPTIQMLYSGKNERQEKETTTKRAQQSPYPSSPSPIEAFRGTVPVRLYPSQPLSRSYTKIKKEKKERKQKETSLESLSTSRTFFFFFFLLPPPRSLFWAVPLFRYRARSRPARRLVALSSPMSTYLF